MLKFIWTSRLLTNVLGVLIFTLFFKIGYCQNNYTVDNSEYYFSQDTIGNEGQHGLVLETGLKKKNNKTGLWIGMYTDTCEFFSAKIYSDKGLNTNASPDQNSKNTTYQTPILSLFNYTDAIAIYLNDSVLNLSYSIYINKPGVISNRSFENGESYVYYSYYKNGTIGEHISSDYKIYSKKIYDENGKLIEDKITKDYILNTYNTKYDSKGELLSKGKFKNDLPHGIWKTYLNSKLVKIEKYKNGVLLSKTFIY